MRGHRSLLVVVLIVLASQTGLALLPVLAVHVPVVLLILRPQPETMVLLSGSLHPAVVFAVAAPLRFLIHVAYYEFGRWGGEVLVSRTRAGRWVLRALSRRWLGTVLLLSCLVHQSTPVDAALGARATERKRVVVALAIGVSISSALLVYLGIRLTSYSAKVLWFLREHPATTTVLVGTIAVVSAAVTARHTIHTARTVREATEGDTREQRADLARAIRSHYEQYPFIEGGQARIDLWTPRLRSLLPNELIRGARVLDVGSSVGEVARSLADRGAWVACLDVTRAATLGCRERHEMLRVVQADALALPFRSDAFEHSIAIGVLHHTPDCRRGLAEMSRVTRRGGRIVVLLYNRWTPYHALYAATPRLRRRHSADLVDRLPRWAITPIRATVRVQIGLTLDNQQLKRLIADQIWTPHASFHTSREVDRWARQLGLKLVRRKRIPLYSTIFVFESGAGHDSDP
jgi:ubiquinone/menaquinone biosynthesis C-methylase UbiE